ncbi:hypothetical protein F9K98_10680 [Brucella anthropi]|nr:hypothetical protein F9K98_10680 [Brucella anthropi]
MGHFSLWHWLIAAVFWWLAFGWPGSKILQRVGYSRWWILLSVIPIANIVGIWLLASNHWPKEPKQDT